MIWGRPVVTLRIDESSDERLYLTKVHTNDFVSLSLIYLVLSSDVKDHLAFVVQTDSWATDLSFTKTLIIIR